jgi:glycosyltransferase involved in cell wall biosynthesis
MKSARVLLIIPCYNEQDSIASLLEEISQCCPGHEVLVIDDGSHDNTFSIARAKAPTVRLVRNLGIGGAVQTGIKYAQRHDFDFCVQIDGDGQHPPGEVTKLLLAYAQYPAAITIGSRYLTNGSFRSTRIGALPSFSSSIRPTTRRCALRNCAPIPTTCLRLPRSARRCWL